jgi:hypothetical protein
MIDGSVADRQEVVDVFRTDDDIRVLLSSEVGSEGLDMQFCDTIVNYDLPWNPMVVEQRIGRIDRIGQLAENIFIYNLIVKGSISEEIYERLENRIGIFEGTIGDLEPILSAPYRDGQSILEVHNNIETKYYKGEITKEQALREEEGIRQAIEAQRMTIEELSRQMSKNTISMDSYYDEQINFIQKRKAYVTDVELRNLLTRVLNAEKSGCSQCILEQSLDDARIWKLKIPQNLDDRDCLVKFLNQNRPDTSDSMRAYDGFVKQIRGKTELSVTFDQVLASENRQMVFVNNYSPLILACNEFRTKSGLAVKKVFKLELRAEDDRNGVLKAGDKFFLLNYQLMLSGVSGGNAESIKELCPVLFDIHREGVVSCENIVASVCCLAQDCGRETQMPMETECSRELIAKFKALATQAITGIVAEKKKDFDEQNNVERARWAREYTEFYEGKIRYYQSEIEKLERRREELSRPWMGGFSDIEESRAKVKNAIAGYTGAITKLRREKDEKLAGLGRESNVSISREEVSACYIVVK